MQYGWLDTEPEHHGKATAQFEAPSGKVSGSGEIHLAESGSLSVKLQVESYELDEPSDESLGPFELLTGTRPQEYEGVSFSQASDYSRNVCTSLKIETADGVFEAESTILYAPSDFFSEKPLIHFFLLSARFDAATKRQPRYWVAPLSNFVSSYVCMDSALDSHPLRLRKPIPATSAETSEDDSTVFDSESREPLIRFDYQGAPAFLEPLPDYEDRIAALVSGGQRSSLTATMVGEVGENPTGRQEDLEGWFPFELTTLLSLTTGSEVGSPWAEIRDEDGLLVRRIYHRSGKSCYTPGHRAIDERLHGGTGQLLTAAGKAPASELLREPYMKVCIKQAVRSQLHEQPLEEQVAHAFRAIDTLCVGRGLQKELKPEDTLCEENRQALERSIDRAKKEVKLLSQESQKGDRTAEAEALARIADQLPRAKNLSKGFPRAVFTLLEEFGLPDAQILEEHYRINRRPDKRKWSDLLGYYRGKVIHRNYLGITRENREKMWDALSLRDHIHDLLLRVLLKAVGYAGQYQPTVEKRVARRNLDWVNPSTPVEELGYR